MQMVFDESDFMPEPENQKAVFDESDFMPESINPQPEGAFASAAREAVMGVSPTLAGVGTAAGAGRLVGALAPHPAIKIGAPIVGAIAGGMLGEKAQDIGLESIVGEEKMAELEAQRAANVQAHPIATMLGSTVPQLITGKPSIENVRKAFAGIGNLAKGIVNPQEIEHIANVGIGAGLSGVQEAYQQWKTNPEDRSPLRFIGQVLLGALINENNRLGARVFKTPKGDIDIEELPPPLQEQAPPPLPVQEQVPPPLPIQEPTTTQPGGPDAIQERVATEIPVAEEARTGAEVVQGTPEPKPEVAPVEEGGKAEVVEKPTDLMTPEEWVPEHNTRVQRFIRMREEYEADVEMFGQNSPEAKASRDEMDAAENAMGASLADGAHQRFLVRAITAQRPVSAAAVDAYGMKLPEGYVREGDRYVFKGEKAKPPEAAPVETTAPAGENPNFDDISRKYLAGEELTAEEQAMLDPTPEEIALLEKLNGMIGEKPVSTKQAGEPKVEPAATPEPAAKEQVISSKIEALRASITDDERAAFGLPPRDSGPVEKHTDLIDQAVRRNEEDPTYADKVVDRVMADPERNATAQDRADLLIAKKNAVDRRNRLFKEWEDSVDSNADQKVIMEKRAEYEKAHEYVGKVFDSISESATETARSLSAQRMAINEQFDYINIERQMRMAKGKKNLSDSEMAEAKKLSDELQETLSQKLDQKKRSMEEDAAVEDTVASKVIDEKTNAEFEKLVASVMDNVKKRTTKTKALELADRLEKEALEGFRTRTSKTYDITGVAPAVLADLAKLVSAYMIRGVVKAADISAKVFELTKQKFDDETIQSAMKRAAVDVSKAISEVPVPKKGAQPKSLSGAIKALYKAQVESGVRNRDEATSNIVEILKGEGMEMTPAAVLREFSDYGKIKKVKTDEVSRTMASFRREAQLDLAIQDVLKKLAPLKTGQQRYKSTPEIRRLEAELKRLMKERGIQQRDTQTQLATARAAAETRLKNQIEDLDKAIKKNERLPAKGQPREIGPEEAGLIAQRDALKKTYDEMFPKQEADIETQLRQAESAAERNLAELQKKEKLLKQNIASTSDKTRASLWSKKLGEIKLQQKAIREAIQEFKKGSPEYQVEQRIKRTRAATSKLEQRMKKGELKPAEKPQFDFSSNEEYMAATKRHAEAKEKFQKKLAELEWNELSKLGKTGRIVGSIYDDTRNLVGSIDNSFIGRQGYFTLITSPRVWAQGFLDSWKAAKKSGSAKVGQQLEQLPNYRNGLYKRVGLAIMEPDGKGGFTHADDIGKTQILGKLPVVGTTAELSNRMYATAANTMRTQLFDMMMKKLGDPNGKDEQLARDVANYVNIITGKKSVPGSGKFLSRLLWAPSFYNASIQHIAMGPLLSAKSPKAKAFIAKEYAKTASVILSMYGVAKMFGADVEEDWRSGQFGEISIGNMKVNPLNYLKPWFVLMGRLNPTPLLGGGGIKRADGEIERLRFSSEDKYRYGGFYKVIGDFLRSKAHPSAGMSFDWVYNKQFMKNDEVGLSYFAENLFPLTIRQMPELYDQNDPITGTFWNIANMHGFPVRGQYKSEKDKVRENVMRVRGE